MILLLASLAFAEEPQPKYTEIEKGEAAAFTGYLLDKKALNLLAVQAKVGLECPTEIDYQVGLMEAKKQQELEMIVSQYELDISMIETTKIEQLRRIEELEKLKQPVSRGWWVALGAALGVGTTIAIANAVN